LYAIGAASTAIGVLVVALLNLATPLDYFLARRAEVLEAGWSGALFFAIQRGLILVGVIALNTVLIAQVMRVSLRPLSRCLRLLSQGQDPEPALLTLGRRQLLNLPFTFVPANLVGWLAASLAIYGITLLFHHLDHRSALALAVRSLMVGVISSAVAFFWLEDHARRRLVPLLFPSGHLDQVPGARRISISRRVLALYWLGSLLPMLILLVTLFILQYEVDYQVISAADYGRGIIVFTLVLAGVTFATIASLTKLVARSISDPLERMVMGVREVQKGNYRLRFQVVSNDEIGALGDAGNQLIQGLAERELLHTLFGKYVTPEIRDEILQGRIAFLGDRREATVMFADLRNFTVYVEAHPPEVVIADMRAYFTAMHRAIRAHGGVVLQFAGDQIEAAFGVPVARPDHADAAVRAALAMRAALAELTRQRAAEGREAIAHGVGIHSGKVLAGNSGSEDQSAYALIGDTVNLASRIQDLTKKIGCDILISQQTAARLQEVYPLGEPSLHEVKGASRPVLVMPVE
jgi:class 3 adenylate cyclase